MRLCFSGYARKPSGRAAGLTVLALAFVSLRAIAQESQSQDPPSAPAAEEQTSPPSEPSEDASSVPGDEKLAIEDMKALSDADLRALYLEEPWRLPEDFGDDSELLERVMSLNHPEMEPGSETSEHPEQAEQAQEAQEAQEAEQAQTTETTPKPKPQPDAR